MIVTDDLLLRYLLGASVEGLVDPWTTPGFALRLLARVRPQPGMAMVGKISRAVDGLSIAERNDLAHAIVARTLEVKPLLITVAELKNRKLAANILQAEYLAAAVVLKQPLRCDVGNQTSNYPAAAEVLGLDYAVLTT